MPTIIENANSTTAPFPPPEATKNKATANKPTYPEPKNLYVVDSLSQEGLALTL